MQGYGSITMTWHWLYRWPIIGIMSVLVGVYVVVGVVLIFPWTKCLEWLQERDERGTDV